MALLQATLIYDRRNDTFANKVDDLLRKAAGVGVFKKSRHMDMREAYVHSDMNIHVDLPVFCAVPWAHVNIAIRRTGDNWNSAYENTLSGSGFDAVIEEEELDRADFGGGLMEMVALARERRPKRGVFHCPPILNVEDCPPISIITPTFNRKQFIEIAFHNLLATDYPADKIEWIVIEDAERSEDMASDKIVNFQVNHPAISVKYIPIQGRMTIGEKRNIAVENAKNDIILFMDDDDHYPVTSFRRRVAWLERGVRGGQVANDVAFCTTIALYDLKRGVSAVNVPPWGINTEKRISEATLTFRKGYWLENKFKNVSIAEGEEWVVPALATGRCIEIPPQQVIVAFSHGGNVSERRIPPADSQVGCFWGFPKEYLIFVHKMAGVEVEEDKSGGGKKR